MKAVITIPLNSEDAEKALKAIQEEARDTERTRTEYKITKQGLEIEINSKDTTGLRAAVNGALKLYKVHEDVKTCLNYQKKQETK